MMRFLRGVDVDFLRTGSDAGGRPERLIRFVFSAYDRATGNKMELHYTLECTVVKSHVSGDPEMDETFRKAMDERGTAGVLDMMESFLESLAEEDE